MVLSIMSLKVWHMTQNVPYFCRLWAWRFYDFPTEILPGIFVVCANKLTLPFKTGRNALSVTCGDSSPKGGAKDVLAQEMERICTDTLHSLFYDHPINAYRAFSATAA